MSLLILKRNILPAYLSQIKTRDIIYEINRSEINPKHLKLIKPIGSGSFGTVYLCYSQKQEKYYALKVINKEKVKSKSHKRYAVAEKTIFKLIENQFIIKCYACFETDIYLFFVLEYCTGKALSSYLDEEGCFDETKARFYICQCIAAINALHNKGIMYRDLKPNNIMLDGEGHIKLIDFNLSKEGFENNYRRTNSFCGSFAYMPPEIINHKSYTRNVDWYLVGILCYEMLTGLPPYFSKNSKMIQK